MKISNVVLLAGGILLGAWLGDHAAMASGITQSAYATVQNSGSSLKQRQTLNFTGSISCVDASPVTTCTDSGGSGAFSTLMGGTNTTAAMLVGTGASLGPTGTGTVNANRVNGAAVPASQSCLGSNSGSQLIAGTCSGSGGNASLAGTWYATGGGTEVGPLYPMTDPSALSLTNINFAGTTSSVASGNALFLSDTAGPATNNLRGQIIAAPATPYTVTAAFIPVVTSSSAATPFGLLFGNGTSYESFGPHPTGPDLASLWWWNSTTSVSGIVQTYGGATFINGLVWFRIVDNGTNKLYCTGNDGVHFTQLFTEASNAFLSTTTQVGWMIDDFSSSNGILVLSFKTGAGSGC